MRMDGECMKDIRGMEDVWGTEDGRRIYGEGWMEDK